MIVLAIEDKTYKIIDFDDDMDVAFGCVCMSRNLEKTLRAF